MKKFAVISGYAIQMNDNVHPMCFCGVGYKIKTDRDYFSFISFMRQRYNLKDFYITNVLYLERTMDEKDYLGLTAEAIANNRDCNPPAKEAI